MEKYLHKKEIVVSFTLGCNFPGSTGSDCHERHYCSRPICKFSPPLTEVQNFESSGLMQKFKSQLPSMGKPKSFCVNPKVTLTPNLYITRTPTTTLPLYPTLWPTFLGQLQHPFICLLSGFQVLLRVFFFLFFSFIFLVLINFSYFLLNFAMYLKGLFILYLGFLSVVQQWSFFNYLVHPMAQN